MKGTHWLGMFGVVCIRAFPACKRFRDALYYCRYDIGLCGEINCCFDFLIPEDIAINAQSCEGISLVLRAKLCYISANVSYGGVLCPQPECIFLYGFVNKK